MDVDYSGSDGYGREYRDRLKGNWGALDWKDCVAAVDYLKGQGLVDPGKVAIDGGSAGGYVTLCCLAFSKAFSAGCSKYGISDLKSLYHETHKFESRYMDGLIGPLETCEAVYDERCPINYVSDVSCPVLFLQGTEDKVVPPNQSRGMFDVLKERGLRTAMVLYEGEQHGFRKDENRKHSLEVEEDFFNSIFELKGGGDVKVQMGEVEER